MADQAHLKIRNSTVLSLIPTLWQRLEFLSVPGIALSFWTLLVLVQVNLQGSIIRTTVLSIMLICSLIIIGFAGLRTWRLPGAIWIGILFLGSIASYLVIGVAVSFFSDTELQTRDLTRQVFFLVLTLAAMIGGRWIIERFGFETVLKWTLVILTVGCVVILATPLWREAGLLQELRYTRFTGFFTDPNDAGFLGSITVVLAVAFIFNRHKIDWLAFLALILGYAAVMTTLSYTALAACAGTIALLSVLRFYYRNLYPLRNMTIVLATTLISVIFMFITISEWDMASLFTRPPDPTPAISVLVEDETTPTPTPAPTPDGQINDSGTNGILDTFDDVSFKAIRGDLSTDEPSNPLSRRTELWAIGFEEILDSPFVGQGFMTMRSLDEAPLQYEYRPEGVHNLYLMLIGEAGIVPLAMFVAALLLMIWHSLTLPTSSALGKYAILGWVLLMIAFAMSFHHLLTMGTYSFFLGFSCAIVAFLIQQRRGTSSA